MYSHLSYDSCSHFVELSQEKCRYNPERQWQQKQFVGLQLKVNLDFFKKIKILKIK